MTLGIKVKPTHPAGIYYERLPNLRLIHHNWELVIDIDVQTSHARLRAYKEHVQQMTRHAEKMDADVAMIDELKYQLNEKFKQAREYFQSIRMMKKNIASTIPEKDQRSYDKQIASLSSQDSEVVLKIDKNLALVNSTLSVVSKDLLDGENQLHTNLTVLWARVNDPSLNLTTSEYEDTSKLIINAIDMKLDYYINNSEQILDNLNSIINQHKIDPTLLKADRLKYLFQLMEQFNYPYLLPFDEDTMSIEKLHGVVDLRYALQRGKF